jgi:RNA polymerase sigma-70 factor (ECF subfamily)
MHSGTGRLQVSVSLEHRASGTAIAIELSALADQDAATIPKLALRAAARGSFMERDLVTRARGGDADAFAQLCRQIGNRLFAVAYNILGDRGAAEDAAQQAMIDIWRHLPQLRDVAQFESWSYRVVANAAYAEGGRLRRWAVAARPVRVITSEGDHAPGVVARDELERAMARLTMEQRAVLVLKHVADLSNDDIATVLEIPVGTVRSRLHHAQNQLRAAFDAEERAPGMESRA